LMAEKAANYGPATMRMVEKSLVLQILDQTWKEHLLGLDHLRQGIGLRAYGQRDPLNEYKQEAFDMFQHMLGLYRERVTTMLCRIELRFEEPPEMPAGPESALDLPDGVDPSDPSTWGRVSRNASCPCGSGKKFKHCHGKV
ncbi:MAG: SEC-C domain-containing protein, partial [Rhodospirillaceae bacterium]|nr:SEC-C domain-containing protein [Rhodospirillaceae bacterium]